MNVIEGEASTNSGDWNGDSLVVNPGDDFGLLPYLLLLQDFARSQSTSPAWAAVLEPLQRLVIDTEDASRLAQRIAGGDTIDEVRLLGARLAELHIEASVAELVTLAQALPLAYVIPLTSAAR
ncbi:MAG: hypothetical protein AB1449_04475 [Chloroflexota bacterium]